MYGNDNKKFVEEITSMDQDFAQWYTDIVKKSDLIDYSSVRGCMIIRPYGYAIWENIQKELDIRFKQTGHQNVYMPMFIPESMLQKEKDHVEGFAPEVAWVTYGGQEQLTERLCVRPTSEVLFCEHYSNIIHSYRDLPMLYNQWCSVVRWEKSTRPFLRTVEFLWQEGHTAHQNSEDAHQETIKMLNLYESFCEEVLAIPVIKGKKTEKEKFAGAVDTYTIESLMHDGKILQSGTSHNLGDGFAKAFNINYTDRDNSLRYVHQTSWGVSTRLIGGLIMVHGDDNGLILPPKVAPIQVVIVPISSHKEGVLEKAVEIEQILSKFFRVKLECGEKSPGWAFSEYEMKGVPLRIEIGPRDIAKNQVVIARRDTSEKISVGINVLENGVKDMLDSVQQGMLDKALALRRSKTFSARTMDEFVEIITNTPGFIKAMWCGNQSCEDMIKQKTAATARCIPFIQEDISNRCICCGEEAKYMVYWGKAY